MKLLFNTSMPRAGSELLQCILHQNPDIYASSTSPLLEYQFGARQNYDLAEVKSQNPQLMFDAFVGMCKGMADSYYEAITDRPIVIDKNRGWSHYKPWVDQWNPNSKMICMVRDLRSIIASMERIYRNNRHSPESIDNPSALQNMTLDQRIDHWLTSQPIGLALIRTFDAIQRGDDKDMLFVRYEDLTNNPEAELKKIYNYIGEPEFNHNFKEIKKEVQEDDSHFGIFGKHSIKSELTPAKYQDWNDVLPKEIAVGIKNRVAWYFDYFGY